MIPRIYVEDNLQSGSEISLGDKNYHHLTRVLRSKINDEVSLFNGSGGEFIAKIISIDKKTIKVLLFEFKDINLESNLKIHLAQGIARGEKMDFIIQKAVELGVSEITPLFTDKCHTNFLKNNADKKIAHWLSIIISACEQCGRNSLPLLNQPASYKDWIVRQNKPGFILTPHHKTDSIAHSKLEDVILIIGPEGGFTSEEVTRAFNQHFAPLQLGPRILRTETATVTALAILQAQYGDLRGYTPPPKEL